MWRSLLKLAVVLSVLVAILAGGGWYLLHDEAFLKSRLKAAALKYTGRELTLNGPVSLQPGWETTLEAGEIQFANADWAGTRDMVTIGHLKISIDLPSLFGDKPIFPYLGLQDCNIQLLKNDEGKTNWDLVQRKDTDSETGRSPRKDLPVRFNELNVSNCALVLVSPDLDQPLDIKMSDLSMQHHPDDRWEGQGSGSVNSDPLKFSGWVNPVSALFLGGPLTHDLTVSLGKITLQSSGSVQDAKTWAGANITTRLQGPDIAHILNEFKLPRFSEGAFDYRLRLNTEGKMTQVDLDGDLGSVDIIARGELDRLVRPQHGDIQFTVDGPNLGALAKVFGVDGLVENAFHHESRITFRQDSAEIGKATVKTDFDQLEIGGHFNTGPGFPGTELDIRFQSDEAGRWTTLFGQPRQALGPLDIQGSLSADANGLFSIRANASQGATTLAADGPIGHLPDTVQPELNIVLNSKDASRLAAVAGWKNFPTAPLAISGRIGMKNRQLQLDKVNVELAGDQANVNGLLNLQDRFAGTNLAVELNIRNTAALGHLFGKDGLPDQPLEMAMKIEPSGSGLAFQVGDGNLGAIQLEFTGQIPDLQKPHLITGNFDIGLPRLSDISFLLPDWKLPDEPFSATGKITAKDKRLQLENVAVSLGANRAAIAGILVLENRYAGSDLDIHIDVGNAGALARSFGHEGIPDQPLKLDAEVKPDGKGMSFKVNDGNLGDIQLEVQGQIADMQNPQGLNAQFDVALPRLSDLSFLLPERDLPDVPFKVTGRLVNEKTQTRLDQVHLEIGKITARVDGNLYPQNRFELTVLASGPDVSGLAKVFGQDLRPDPFSLSAQLSGTPSEFDLNELKASLGDSKAEGELQIGLGDVSKISGKLDSPYFDISQWIADAEESSTSAQKPKRQWVFDEKPVMDIVDLPFDLDLDITIAELKLRVSTITDLNLGLALSHDLVELKPFHFQGDRGGVFNGEARLDSRGAKPQFHMNLNGKDLRLGLAAAPGQEDSTVPPMELDLLADGTGRTRHEMASSLDGKLRIYQGHGQIAQAGIELFFSDFITELFTLLNPFAKTSKYTTLDCGVIAANAVSGEVDVFPVIFNTDQLTILSQGTIDLNSEKIDLAFNSKARKGLGLSAGVLINPLIKVGGTLAEPAIQFDPAGTVKSTGLAVATAGISLLAKSVSDRFLSSADPCGDARAEIEKRDSE